MADLLAGSLLRELKHHAAGRDKDERPPVRVAEHETYRLEYVLRVVLPLDVSQGRRPDELSRLKDESVRSRSVHCSDRRNHDSLKRLSWYEGFHAAACEGGRQPLRLSFDPALDFRGSDIPDPLTRGALYPGRNGDGRVDELSICNSRLKGSALGLRRRSRGQNRRFVRYWHWLVTSK